MGKKQAPVVLDGAKKGTRKKQGKSSASTDIPEIPSAVDLSGAVVGTQYENVEDATLHMYTMRYCNDGSVYGEQFEEEMYAVHWIYPLYPSVIFNILKSIEAYCKESHDEDPEEPATLDALSEKYGIKIIATSGADPDKVLTFKKNRVVFYTNKSSLKSLFLYADSWLTWRLDHPSSAEDPPFPPKVAIIIHVPNEIELEFKPEDRMENEVTISRHPFDDKANVWEGHPPVFPSRPVVASIEGISNNFVAVVFAGNTKPFATNFDAAGIGRKKGTPLPGSEFPEWYRVVSNKDIGTDEGLKEICNVFAEVLVGAPVFVRIKKFPQDDARFKVFLNSLKMLQNIKFL